MNLFTKLCAVFLALGVLGLVVVGCPRGGKGINHPMKMGWGIRGGRGMERCPMMGGRGMMDGRMMEMGDGGMMGEQGSIGIYLLCAGELGLNNEQVKKLKDRQSAFLKESIDLRAKLQVSRIELSELLDQDPVNMTAVEKKVRANQDLTATLILAAIRANQDAKNILTPDQRKKAETLKRTVMADMMWGRRHGPRMEGKGPEAPMPRERGTK
jgi:hypothetical protein